MKKLYCENCGGDEFVEEDGFRICRYCKSKFIICPEDTASKESRISLNEDVLRLLRMCQENPAKADKYANLILDIDPTNKEAYKYIGRK